MGSGRTWEIVILYSNSVHMRKGNTGEKVSLRRNKTGNHGSRRVLLNHGFLRNPSWIGAMRVSLLRQRRFKKGCSFKGD